MNAKKLFLSATAAATLLAASFTAVTGGGVAGCHHLGKIKGGYKATAKYTSAGGSTIAAEETKAEETKNETVPVEGPTVAETETQD